MLVQVGVYEAFANKQTEAARAPRSGSFCFWLLTLCFDAQNVSHLVQIFRRLVQIASSCFQGIVQICAR